MLAWHEDVIHLRQLLGAWAQLMTEPQVGPRRVRVRLACAIMCVTACGIDDVPAGLATAGHTRADFLTTWLFLSLPHLPLGTTFVLPG